MKTSDSTIIPSDNTSAWTNALRLCGVHDIYHLSQYHSLAEDMGEGKAYLFFCYKNGAFAALPFLLRQVADVKGLEKSCFNDITSVYGYPGVLTSIDEDSEFADHFRDIFQSELLQVFKQLSVVTFFSRTNPLLPNTWMLEGMAEIFPLSTTIAIDLLTGEEEQLRQMSKGHKYDIRKACKNGVIVEEDISFQYIDDFILIYNETMKRNNASAHYYFPKKYYLQLKKSFKDSIRLYFAKIDGVEISASMFFFEGNIIQYHLSGSLPEYFHLNGAKLILDHVRRLGKQNGFAWLHLGGGVGSSEDNLFRFKAGFSKLRLPFHIVRMVINQDVYAELCDNRRKWAQDNKYIFPDNNFFPDYRKPMK